MICLVPTENSRTPLRPLVERARAGDEAAWNELIAQTKNVIWRTVNGFDLGHRDAEEAFAATLFRLAENLHQLRDPEYLPGWLATTARNESLALLRSRRRLVVMDQLPEHVSNSDGHDHAMLTDERQEAVRQAFDGLSNKCKKLLRLLATDPPTKYRDISETLDMPIGSIGATRERCLKSLRTQPALVEYLREAS